MSHRKTVPFTCGRRVAGYPSLVRASPIFACDTSLLRPENVKTHRRFIDTTIACSYVQTDVAVAGGILPIEDLAIFTLAGESRTRRNILLAIFRGVIVIRSLLLGTVSGEDALFQP